MSDLQRRTEQQFRDKGYLTTSVERRKRFPARGKPKCRVCGSMPMIDISVDLWNVFDLLAVRPLIGAGCSHPRIFIQVTNKGNHANHRNKILGSPEAKMVLASGFSILIQSWRKEGNRWQARDEWITDDMFVEGLPASPESFYESERKAKLDDLPPGTTLPLSELLGQEPF